MNFEVMESVEMESSATEEFPGSTLQVAKRKRTKRRRNAMSSSSGGGDVDGGDDGKTCIPSLMVSDEDLNYESTVTTEEEDEDVANCLMMLARSGSGSGGCDGAGEDYEKTERKRKAEISVIGGVYECKTCDKAFQSFQALGGHRASHHKKAKLEVDVKPTASSIEQIQLMLNNTATYSTTTATHPANTNPPSSSSSVVTHSTKVHQCAICGTAFSSGQALGGHMRRHRAAVVSSTVDNNHISTVTVALSTYEKTPDVVGRASENNSFLSSLDLNLPAPAEEDHTAAAAGDENHHTRFNQQFPPMVGCYF